MLAVCILTSTFLIIASEVDKSMIEDITRHVDLPHRVDKLKTSSKYHQNLFLSEIIFVIILVS